MSDNPYDAPRQSMVQYGLSVRYSLIGTVIGAFLAIGFLALSYWYSTLPAMSPVSLKWSFTPWWRHWAVALGAFVLPVSLGLAIDT